MLLGKDCIMTTIKRLLLATLMVFAPVQATLMTAITMVVLDFILGIAASKKEATPITSYRMRDTVGKLLAYEGAIMIAYLAQTYLAKELPLTNIIGTYVALTEGTSCLENLNRLTNSNVLQVVIDKFNALK